MGANEDHIEMWVEAKLHGQTSGIPSIHRLCHDAEDIDKMLETLAFALLQ